MNDTLPEEFTQATPSFKLSRWLFSMVVTTSLVFGAIAGIAVLLLGEGMMDAGEDPAIPAEEIQQNVARADARIDALEKRIAQLPQPSDTSESTAEIKSDVTTLEEKVGELKTAAIESRAGQIVLAVSQIKDAYENDLPMQPGIELLKKSVTTPEMQAKLDELSTAVDQTFPKKSELVQEAEAIANIKAGPVFNADQGPSATDVPFKDRVKGLMGRFIQVEKGDAGATRVASTGLISALRQDDLPAASNMISRMPVSPQLQLLAQKIDARLQIQTKVRSVVNGVMQAVTPSGSGALY